MNDPQRSTLDASRLPESAPNPKAIAAALAPQETTYDEGGLRFYVTRREQRVDVSFRSVREGEAMYPGMEPLWLFTALLHDDGIGLVQQEGGSGEDATQFFPSLTKHLAAHPIAPAPEAVDARFLIVADLHFRARRFNRGFGEIIRVDLRIGEKEGVRESFLHAFDAEFVPSMMGHAATLTVGTTSSLPLPAWGQIKHLVPWAVSASFATERPCEEITAQLPDFLNWADNDGIFAAKAVA